MAPLKVFDQLLQSDGKLYSKFQMSKIGMGLGKLSFFWSKVTHESKNFENQTTFRFAHNQSKFYYTTHLCEARSKKKI